MLFNPGCDRAPLLLSAAAAAEVHFVSGRDRFFSSFANFLGASRDKLRDFNLSGAARCAPAASALEAENQSVRAAQEDSDAVAGRDLPRSSQPPRLALCVTFLPVIDAEWRRLGEYKQGKPGDL